MLNGLQIICWFPPKRTKSNLVSEDISKTLGPFYGTSWNLKKAMFLQGPFEHCLMNNTENNSKLALLG